MLNKILSSVLAASVAVYAPVVAFADESASVSIVVDASTGEAKLSGKANGTVSITVVPEDVTFTDYTQELQKCIYFGFATAKGGTFTHSFNIPDQSQPGKYIVHISSSDGNAKCSFSKIGNLDSNGLASVNNVGSGAELKTAAEALATELGIDMSKEDYARLAGDAFEFIYALGKDYDSAAEFYKDFNLAYALSDIVNSEDAESALEKNASVLGMDFAKDYADDDRLTDNAKKILLSAVCSAEWSDIISEDIAADFAEEYNILKAVSAVSASKTRVQLQKAICEDFSLIFDFVEDNTTYKNLQNPDKVFEYMLSDSSDNIDSILRSFENAVDMAYDNENPPKRNNGGGGGGGSVGISSSVAPPVQPPVPLDEIKNETPKDNNTETKVDFSDVKSDFWAYDAIDALSSKGLINGYEDSTFKPDNTITRAEFAKLVLSVYQAKGGTLSSGGIAFDDVNVNDWYYDVADKASALGIIMGSDGNFRPNDSITRQDVAVIIYRTMVKLNLQSDVQKSFGDSSLIADYAVDAVSALSGAGVINGFEDNTFKPQHTLTRAQAAQIIYNVVK